MNEPLEDHRHSGLVEVLRQPAARSYLFIAGAALIVYYTQMSLRGGDLGTLLAVVIALPGLAARWVISPALFLILTVYLLFDPNFDRLLPAYDRYYRATPFRHDRASELGMPDLFLAASILVYLMAQIRLLSLAYQSMPDDPPPRRKGQPEPIAPRRPPRLFADREIGVMFAFVPICVLTGLVIWLALSRYESDEHLGRAWGIEQPFARLMLFSWAFVTGAILAGVVFRYWALRSMSRVQARLMLQDMFWQETRREQERIHFWRRWYRKSRGDTS